MIPHSHKLLSYAFFYIVKNIIQIKIEDPNENIGYRLHECSVW
jgi:hypothetical protein